MLTVHLCKYSATSVITLLMRHLHPEAHEGWRALVLRLVNVSPDVHAYGRHLLRDSLTVSR